ncbi:MAG: Gmad2 immunoglobulin-like domain-containing protein [Salinimicrobium sp.]
MKNYFFLLLLIFLSSCGNENKNSAPAEVPVKVERNEGKKDITGIVDLLLIEQPSKNDKISSPLKIEGRARGSWYFEGQFPVELVAEDGKILAKTSAKAEGDWMTEGFVPFSAEVEFEAAGYEEGKLILRRSNASGLPENDRSYRLPVYFKQ